MALTHPIGPPAEAGPHSLVRSATVLAAVAQSSIRPSSVHRRARRELDQALLLVRQGRWAQALPMLLRVTRAEPGVALHWAHLAVVQRRLHRQQEAIASAERAFALDRSSPLVCHQLAELLRLNNRHARALQVLRALDPAAPRDITHGLLEGALCQAMGQPEQAARAFLSVLALQPVHVEAYLQLGLALAGMRCHREAAESFRTACTLAPAQIGAALYALHSAAWVCDWGSQAQDLQRLQQAWDLASAAADRDPAGAVSFSPFCLLSLSDQPHWHLRAARLESARMARQLRQRLNWQRREPGPGGYPLAAHALRQGRCRLGFVAGDFRTHATSLLLVQTLERLPRDRFEVLLYSHGRDDGSMLRQRCERAADRFVDCSGMALDQQAEQIREDGVALLVDLGGYTAQTRLPLFALRPAPLQVSWLAYPGSVGADFIDYLVGDPVVTPLAHADQYDEKLAQLPRCYQPTDELRPHPETMLSRTDLGLPEQGFVFASFNQSYKISEDMFARWCRILHRVPGSVLWLLVESADARRQLMAQAQTHGLAAERLVFAPFVDNQEHLARIPLADLFLDSFPCGAHTTCTDALWMGLPVLTLIGQSFASRVAASLLQAVGLPELAVQHPDDYEDLAVRLAEDVQALTEIRDHLWQNRRDLPLFDNQAFTMDLAALFDRMASRWLQGLPPAALAAELLGVD